MRTNPTSTNNGPKKDSLHKMLKGNSENCWAKLSQFNTTNVTITKVSGGNVVYWRCKFLGKIFWRSKNPFLLIETVRKEYRPYILDVQKRAEDFLMRTPEDKARGITSSRVLTLCPVRTKASLQPPHDTEASGHVWPDCSLDRQTRPHHVGSMNSHHCPPALAQASAGSYSGTTHHSGHRQSSPVACHKASGKYNTANSVFLKPVTTNFW